MSHVLDVTALVSFLQCTVSPEIKFTLSTGVAQQCERSIVNRVPLIREHYVHLNLYYRKSQSGGNRALGLYYFKIISQYYR